VLHALAQVKDNYDSGVFGAIQEAAITALKYGREEMINNKAVFKHRHDIFMEGLQKLGWKVFPSNATFYIWSQTPPRYSSKACAEKLLDDAQIVATPGSGFGEFGEGYIRFALTQEKSRLKTALLRMSKIKW